MSIQSWLNEVWYERPAPPWWLVPPSLLYAAVAAVRRLAYARGLFRSVRLPCPVVVVGNLSAGTYYFAVAAYTSTATQSVQSSVGSETIL